MDTTCTYQGRLSFGTGACTGTYDFSFALYDALTGGSKLGPTVQTNAVPVNNGIFTVTLDFGNVFDGNGRWLQIGVRTNGGGSFIILSPRQSLAPIPYAIAAANLTGALPANQLSGLYSNAVSFNNPASSFVGNGAGLTSVNATTLGGLAASGFWQLGGNLGTSAGVNFLGTSDNQALELKANGQRVLRLEPAGPDRKFPNIIAGDSANALSTNVQGSVIGGGTGNFISTYYEPGNGGTKCSTISGGVSNLIAGWTDSCTIGGGRGNMLLGDGPVTFFGATISGGQSNLIWEVLTSSMSEGSTIAGGSFNGIGVSTYASISGGLANIINYGSRYASISGGQSNSITDYCSAAIIAGGEDNEVTGYADHAVIGGGAGNSIGLGGQWSAILGGIGNRMDHSWGASIGGGMGNSISSNSSAGSTIAGGQTNTIRGSFATIPGGQYNFATDNAFAAGSHAAAQNPGSFVWADASSSSTFTSSAPNQVSFRCSGGVVFSSGTSGGNQMVSWAPGSGGWSFSSDRNLKDRFQALSTQSVLEKVSELPLSEWSYKNHNQRHIGPMAQDFHALFPLNENDKLIDDADLHGVELAAIQGLNHKVETENAALRAQNAQLKARLEKLERLFSTIKAAGR